MASIYLLCINKVFFELPETRPTSHSKCLARSSVCHKVYKFTLTTNWNLFKHLKQLTQEIYNHKEELQSKQQSKVPPDQCIILSQRRSLIGSAKLKKLVFIK